MAVEDPPFRQQFDAARDPYTARNALGIMGTGASFITSVTAPLSVTGGNLTINLSGYQPLDADLTAIAALTGTNTIYYRSAANTWSAVNVSTGLAFSSGNLTATVGATAPPGRLTLQTLTPVMTSTQAGKTTIYYTPYCGNQVPIYDGTTMVMTVIGELSAATTDTTKSPAAIGASKVNDWFVWNDSGTIRIGHGPDWTSDTVRSVGTVLIMVSGLWCNNVSITNGPAAQRGTYVGTTRSNASSQLDWINGGLGVGGIAGVFNVWNCYNRVTISTMVMESTDSWTYTSATWRAASAGSATMRVSYVVGLQEDAFSASYQCTSNGSGGAGVVGIGYDVTNAYSGILGVTNTTTGNSLLRGEFAATSLGAHFMSAIEYATAATVTFYGDAGTTFFQSGLLFTGRF